MMDLDPKAWRAISGKCKIKDNGLEKALSTYEKLADDAHDDCLKTIAVVAQLANALKRAKEVAAAPEAAKFLAGLVSAADKEKSDVAKAKAEADKAQIAADKAKLAADKAQLVADQAKAKADEAEEHEKQHGEDKDDEPDDKKGGLKPILISMLQKVKTAKPDAPFHYLLCEAKPFPYVMIAKQINAGHRKILEKASGGSKRFLKPGTITFEDGHFCFESDKNIPGAAKRVQGFLKNLTGKKYPVMFGTAKASEEDDSPEGQAAGDEAGAAGEPVGDDIGEAAEPSLGAGRADGGGQSEDQAGDEQAEGKEPALNMTAPFSISGSVGRGGKNKPEDVQALQIALNRKIKAGLKVDGKCGPATIKAIMDVQKGLGKFKPDGLVEVGRGTARFLASSAPLGPAPEPPSPLPPPKLGKGTLDGAPTAWRGMHGILGKNIGELKKAVRSEYSSEHPDLLKDIDEALKKLDGVMEKIGLEISDHLAAANAAKDPAERKAKLQSCKGLIAEKIKYVKSEPMIAHMDRNPFGVSMNVQRMLTDHLVHVAQAIGNVG
jgi:hypothetical protein